MPHVRERLRSAANYEAYLRLRILPALGRKRADGQTRGPTFTCSRERAGRCGVWPWIRRGHTGAGRIFPGSDEQACHAGPGLILPTLILVLSSCRTPTNPFHGVLAPVGVISRLGR